MRRNPWGRGRGRAQQDRRQVRGTHLLVTRRLLDPSTANGLTGSSPGRRACRRTGRAAAAGAPAAACASLLGGEVGDLAARALGPDEPRNLLRRERPRVGDRLGWGPRSHLGERASIDRGRGLRGRRPCRARGRPARARRAGRAQRGRARRGRRPAAREGAGARRTCRARKRVKRGPVAGEPFAGGGVGQAWPAHGEPANAQREQIGRRGTAEVSAPSQQLRRHGEGTIQGAKQVAGAGEPLDGLGRRDRIWRIGGYEAERLGHRRRDQGGPGWRGVAEP